MSKISKLNELRDLVRQEKKKISDEVIAELRSGTFDIEDFGAVQSLEIAKDNIQYEVYYQEECRSEAIYGWDGLWTSRNQEKVERLYADLELIIDALKKANEAFNAKIPF
jgi:hypothetical protein